MDKMLTIKDLYNNMTVRVSQLSNILNVCMILVDTKLLPDKDIQGTLVYFGDGKMPEYTNWFYQDKPITPIYFDSAELSDGVVYDG